MAFPASSGILRHRKDAAFRKSFAASQMGEFLRKYWFVSLLAVLFIGVLIYFIADMNKDNVSVVQKDGQDLVVSTDAGDVTSTDLYDASALSSSRILYNAYRNAVVDQSVEMDSAMEKEAKTMARNLEANIKSDAEGKTKYSILSQLASFGFTGDSAVDDYARITVKAKKLDTDFILDHFDSLSEDIPEGARTISILTMQVDNAAVLNDEDTKKKEDIDKALESKDFSEVAKEFSDDEKTKASGGEYGYIDSSTTDLEADVVKAAVALEPGQTSDWITVQPQGAQYYVMYRVHADETDPSKLIHSDDSDVADALATAMINKVSGLEALAIQQAASKMDISYGSDEIKEDVEAFQSSQTSDLASRLGIDTSAAGSASSESSASSTASSAVSSAASSAASSETEGK